MSAEIRPRIEAGRKAVLTVVPSVLVTTLVLGVVTTEFVGCHRTKRLAKV